MRSKPAGSGTGWVCCRTVERLIAKRGDVLVATAAKKGTRMSNGLQCHTNTSDEASRPNRRCKPATGGVAVASCDGREMTTAPAFPRPQRDDATAAPPPTLAATC